MGKEHTTLAWKDALKRRKAFALSKCIQPDGRPILQFNGK